LDLADLAENVARGESRVVIKSRAMNERQQSHVDYYLERLVYWKSRKPVSSNARLLAARDADEAHPLRTEEEATEVVEYLWRLEREQAAG
jgi:hypothetical protein